MLASALVSAALPVVQVTHADLIHRWSFDQPAGDAPSGTTMTDSVSGAAATVFGGLQGVSTFDGTALRIQGTTTGNRSLGFISGYIDLPNGIISSKTHLTLEIWATPFGATNYDRLFDFGRCNLTHGPDAQPGEIVDVLGTGQTPGTSDSDDNLFFSFSVGSDEDRSRMDAMVNDNDSNPDLVFDADTQTSFGTRYHYVMTFEDGAGTFGATGGRVSWYRDGELLLATDVNFRLQDIEDVNNWLGRSQWTNDSNANASYDEVRIYDHALTLAEIEASLTAGPDEVREPDDDEDGLSDRFEDRFFGNNDGNPTPSELLLQSGGDDADNDGLTNLEEQQRGTDPTDPLSPPPPPVPDHLWTFTTQAASIAEAGTIFPDEFGGGWETLLRGNGAQLTGGAVVLPGNTNGNQTASAISAYLDLPDGIISASPDLTIEAWATPVSSKTWQRLFDFGRCVETSGPNADPGEINDGNATPGLTGAWDNLSLTLNNANDLDTHQLEGEHDDLGPVFTTSSAPTVAGTEYHYLLTVEDGVGEFGSEGCRVSWYRDGVLQNTDDFHFRLVDMEDVNNWIGRSMYTGDSNSNLALNELRLYRRVISAGEIQASYEAGPDPSVGPPEPPAPPPIPTHRWDFNTAAGDAPSGTVFTDVVTGETATVRGNGAALNGTELVLPGGTTGNVGAAEISGYLDLPNGFISAHTELSIEAWITPVSSRDWQRLWEFGSCSVTSGDGALDGEVIDGDGAPPAFQQNDGIFLSLNSGGALGSHRLAGKSAGGSENRVDTDLSSATGSGTEYHFVMTVENGAGAAGSTGCQVRWYRDGVLSGTLDLPFQLKDIHDVNNWIGRSNWSADANSHISINELRVYDHPLSPQEVLTSFTDGPDTVYATPVAVDDSATIHRGLKVRLDVLANDEGGVSSLEIAEAPAVGSAVVQDDNTILYTHDGSAGESVTFTYLSSGIGGISDPATVTIKISDEIRIDGTAHEMPDAPPTTSLAVIDAFPGVFFNRPVALATIPGDEQRLFVTEIGGAVHVIPDVTSPTPSSAPVLDLPAAIQGRTPSESIQGGANQECGLLGLAFHPDFTSNGHLYVFYSVVKNGTSGFFQRISRFTVPAGEIANPVPLADPSSEVILIEQYDQGPNHQGGDIHFGLDGYLYISVGDEENPNDFRLNSQRIDKDFFAGLLRIDVDKLPDNLAPNAHESVPLYEDSENPGTFAAAYSIPADNPWVGGTRFIGQTVDPADIRSEFYAVGLRSPWRFSIDSATGDIWVGDVGQDRYEEIDLIEKGGNYGWVFREGAHDINTSNPGWPDKPSNFDEIAIDPVYEYVHNAMAGDPAYKGNSVTGGRVYRGERIPSLFGAYIFGDQVSGHLWSMTLGTGGAAVVNRIGGLSHVSAFGEDPSNRDLLLCWTPANAAATPTYGIKRLVSNTLTDSFPATLSETGIFSDLTDLTPSPGFLHYEPNITFWSDHALKKRWFSIADPAATMTWRKEGPWDYPEGMVWVKHFDMEMERGNPATKKRLETRVLVRDEAGSYGVSYRWNKAETEALLVEDGGVSFPLEIVIDGTPTTQMWSIPSRTQCTICHNAAAGHGLSFNTRQLNREGLLAGYAGNQIELLELAGYLANPPGPTATLPSHTVYEDATVPLEKRARTYLDVNCAYCHRPGGGGPGFDARAELTLEETGLVRGLVAAAEHSDDRLVAPGEPVRSVILSRISETNGYTRMPPLATAVRDEQGIALVTEWIQSELSGHTLYDDWATAYPGLGTRTADDDSDGRSNYAEFLLHSHPLRGTGGQVAEVSANAFRFERRPFRLYDIQTSGNLIDWTSWDVSQNRQNYDASSSTVEIPITPGTPPRQYFRLQVSEP